MYKEISKTKEGYINIRNVIFSRNFK